MAGTTNALQWNPTAANQETDVQYSADSQRAGGATNPSVFEAELANKLFFQLSTYVTALFQAFAAKGFTTSDSNINTLTATCSNFLTTSDFRTPLLNVSYSPNIALDASKYNAWFIPLSGNINLTISGMTDGQIITLVFIQTVAGSPVVTFPVELFTATQPSTGNASCTAQSFIYTTQAGNFFRATGPVINEDSLFQKGSGAFGGNLNFGGIITGPEAHIVTVNASVMTAFNLDISTLANIQALQVNGNVNVGSLQIGGTGSAGQVLTGNGSSYVPMPLPAVAATLNNVTGGRAFGVTYQNTSGSPIFVSGYGSTSGSAFADLICLCGAGSPSIAVFGSQVGATTAGLPIGFSFFVPNGYFYQINTGGTSSTTLAAWVETQVTV